MRDRAVSIQHQDSVEERPLQGFNPRLQLETLFRLDASGMIVSTREPHPTTGPRFTLIRSTTERAWAVRSGTAPEVVETLAAFVAREPMQRVAGDEPRHAAAYFTTVGGRVESGPAFTFPPAVEGAEPDHADVSRVDDLAVISWHFSGWSATEIPGRQPILAILQDGVAVCLCFCARRSDAAAEAGIETAAPHRGRGLAPRVAAAWAAVVRAEGLVPMYSTQWTNTASLAVARKLGLQSATANWSLVDP